MNLFSLYLKHNPKFGLWVNLILLVWVLVANYSEHHSSFTCIKSPGPQGGGTLPGKTWGSAPCNQMNPQEISWGLWNFTLESQGSNNLSNDRAHSGSVHGLSQHIIIQFVLHVFSICKNFLSRYRNHKARQTICSI